MLTPPPKSSKSDRPAMPSRKRRRGDRGFEEIPIVAVGFQSGLRDRYPSSERDTKPPPYLNPWRNNLTALSQHFNLYFIASEDRLLVFEPTVPDQHVSAEPALSFVLPVTRPGLRGHMPGTNPHSVNNMIIDHLGDEEVIMLACDDGDVLGYWTRDLSRGVEDDKLRNGDRRVQRPAKPFFSENVGRSAWGLAVHSQARMIAASSNTHKITIWAPALSQTTERSTHDRALDVHARNDQITSEGWTIGYYTGHEIDANSTVQQFYRRLERMDSTRHLDRRWELDCHDTNVPSISFCNTPEDPHGKYLASTDIDGTTVVWVIHQNIPARVLFPSEEGSGFRAEIDGYDISRDGWAISFLNRRSFQSTHSIVNAMGTCASVSREMATSSAHRPGAASKQVIQVYDITDSRNMVKNAGRWGIADDHPIREHVSQDSGAGGSQSVDATPERTYTSADDDGEVNNDDDNESDGETSMVVTFTLSSPPLSPNDSSSDLQVRRNQTRLKSLELDSSIVRARTTYRRNLAGRIPHQNISASVSERLTRFSTWPMLSNQCLHTGQGEVRSSCPFIPSEKAIPDSPLLLVNARALNLFQSAALLNPPNGECMQPFPRELASTSYLIQPVDPPNPGPVVYMGDPLAQEMQPALKAALERHDRMNLIAQIPELGVILIGSPKGRVAVMTLHQLIPDRFGAINPEKRGNDLVEPIYTMRCDHILPTQQQEEAGQRPLQQLVGLSAGPVFGLSGAVSKERWRVLLLYRDSTVIAYELGMPNS